MIKNSQTQRILILGGAGMLGHKLWQELGAKFEDTWVTLRKPKEHYAFCAPLFDSPKVIDHVAVDDFSELRTTLERVKPDVVINCVAVTKRREAASATAEVIALNSLLPHQLAAWCEEVGSYLIHFSTDCVFDGERGGYSEKDPTNARDLYGKSKALGEVVTSPNALTIRTSFIGRELENGTELIEWFLSQRGKSAAGYAGAIYTGLTTRASAEVIVHILAQPTRLTGLWQVSSEPIDKFTLLHRINQKLGLDVQLTKNEKFQCRRDLIGDDFRNKSGIRIPTWDEMIADLAVDPTPYEKWRKK